MAQAGKKDSSLKQKMEKGGVPVPHGMTLVPIPLHPPMLAT